MPRFVDPSELRRLLDEVRARDVGLRVFGSEVHRYVSAPPLSELALSAFETRHGIQLPEDYRAFVREIANGGAGPAYGLYPLDARGHPLSLPFPLSTQSSSAPPAERDALYATDEYPGVLEICDFGCAITGYLVVQGAARGTVWIGREEILPTGLSFSAWFAQWAATSIRRLANVELVARIRVGMAASEVVDATGAEWRERRVGDRTFFEAADVPAQVLLDANGLVRAIEPWGHL